MSEVRTIMREDLVVSAGWGLVPVVMYLIVGRPCCLQSSISSHAICRDGGEIDKVKSRSVEQSSSRAVTPQPPQIHFSQPDSKLIQSKFTPSKLSKKDNMPRGLQQKSD